MKTFLRLGGKASDMYYTEITDEEGNVLHEEDGYAPQIHSLCGGDYFELCVDVETGKIVGWNDESRRDVRDCYE